MFRKLNPSMKLLAVVCITTGCMAYAASLLAMPLSPRTVQLATAQPTAIHGPAVNMEHTAQPVPTTAQPAPPASGSALPGGFAETFSGMPAQPQAWNPINWDVSVHSRDVDTWEQLEPVAADHGADCGPPPATHQINEYASAVFLCHDHVMTTLKASGYGVIYLTPDHMVDFSQGEAVISWDMSTLRSSKRDWVDVWITPYASNLQLPLDMNVDLSGPPQNAIQIHMDLVQNSFQATVYRNFQATTLDAVATSYDSFLVPDAKRRDTFEIRLSRTHLAVGMPSYKVTWVDTAIADLGWDSGVVQFGHHSYNPLKDCTGPCSPNTWHWDNVQISPARAFTMIKADQRVRSPAMPGPVTLAKPAPAGANLRFAGIGTQLEVSFDGGATWQAAKTQLYDQSYFHDEHFLSYWMPIPIGTQQVQFRGTSWWGGDWRVRDIAVWAP